MENPVKVSALDSTTVNAYRTKLINGLEFIMPNYNNLPVMKDEYLPVFLDNILRYGRKSELLKFSSQNVYLKFFDKYFLINGTLGSGGLGGNIRAHSFATNYYELSKDLNYYIVPAASGNGTSKKVMFIGDSLTENRMYLSALYDLFVADSMDIEFIGTLSTGTTTPNEGRSGWAAYNYATNDLTGFTTDKTNAFWNSGAFDFSHYMTNNGFSGVDIVFINLGTNDLLRGVVDGTNATEVESVVIPAYQTMIDSIRAYNANTKIVLWLPPTRSLIGSAVRSEIDQSLLINKLLISHFDSNAQIANKLYLLPIHYAVDPSSDYSTATISTLGMTITDHGSDIVHPTQSGANKIAKYIFNMIKYLQI